MKKILFTIALVMTIGFCAHAQCDSFLADWQLDDDRVMHDNVFLAMPNTNIGLYDNSSGAPLGSGLLIMVALGAGYATFHKRKE